MFIYKFRKALVYSQKNITVKKVVAIFSRSWVWGSCDLRQIQGIVSYKSLKSSNLGFLAADLQHLDCNWSLVQKVLRIKIAGLRTNMTESSLTPIYKRTLLLELERYDALPFHLAYLYLAFKDSAKLYYGNYEVVKVNSRLKFTKNGEEIVHTYAGGLDKTHKLTPQTLFSFTDTKPTKTFYYQQNTNLVRVINYLAKEACRTHKTIPARLIYPYLFLNKDLEIAQHNSSKLPDILIKYDPQSKLLKLQIAPASRKYRILKTDEMMGLYDGNKTWTGSTYTLPKT